MLANTTTQQNQISSEAKVKNSAPAVAFIDRNQQKNTPDLETVKRLIQYYHEYIRRTGECQYTPLESFLTGKAKLELVQHQSAVLSPEPEVATSVVSDVAVSSAEMTPDINTSTANNSQIVEQIGCSTSEVCDRLKASLAQLSQHLRPASSGTNLSSEGIYQAYRRPALVVADEHYTLLVKEIKTDLFELANNIHTLLELTRKYCGDDRQEHYLDGNGGLELYSLDESTRIHQLARDLNYFCRYFQEKIQISKIQAEIFWAYDSATYFQRLQKYLETLPETVNNLTNLIQSQFEE
jgi:hypothetical protein